MSWWHFRKSNTGNDEIVGQNEITAPSKIWQEYNASYRYLFTSSLIWYVYFSLFMVLVACAICAVQKRELDLIAKRRREENHRAQQRPAQQRRPGAEYRKHIIRRNTLAAHNRYTASNENMSNNIFTLNLNSFYKNMRDVIINKIVSRSNEAESDPANPT